MKNLNVIIVVQNFDPQNEDHLLAVINAVAPFNHDAWDENTITSTLSRHSDDGDTELHLGLDFVYVSKPYGEYGSNEKVVTLDELEQTIKDTWGEEFEKYNIISTNCGNHWSKVAETAQKLATETGKNSIFEFNGTKVIVSATTNLEHLWRDYLNVNYLDVDTVGPDCVENYDEALKEQIRLEKEEEDRKWEEFIIEQEAIVVTNKNNILNKIAKVEFATTSKEIWNEYRENNTDTYGGRCVSYAEQWARLMQAEIATVTKGFSWTEPAFDHVFNKIAEKTAQEADYDGITGFMYGAAVKMLTDCWKHGERLRKWHNKEYGHEGDGVINPAVLTINAE